MLFSQLKSGYFGVMMIFNRISCQSLRLAWVLERRIVLFRLQQQQVRNLSDGNSIKIETVTNNVRTGFNSSSSDVDVIVTTNNNGSSNVINNNNEPKSKRRTRHTFRNNSTLDNIPSFKDFQQTKQIRTLYRQYIRLFKTRQGSDNNNSIIADTTTNNTNTTTTNDVSKELKDQVRREFRQQHTDSWSIKKALSEGTRRYKDLSAMIGMPSSSTSNTTSNTTTSDPNTDNNNNNKDQSNVTSTNQKWPWDNSNTIKRQSPLRFPKKS